MLGGGGHQACSWGRGLEEYIWRALERWKVGMVGEELVTVCNGLKMQKARSWPGCAVRSKIPNCISRFSGVLLPRPGMRKTVPVWVLLCSEDDMVLLDFALPGRMMKYT